MTTATMTTAATTTVATTTATMTTATAATSGATMTKTRIAEALFVSDLQPPQIPTGQVIATVVQEMVQRYGSEGCAARMAAEFGDHPDLAVRRMIWVHRLLGPTGR